MSKNPAYQFYPSDWTRDLDDLDLEIEGAWIRINCRLWWSEKKGESTRSLQEWAKILRKTKRKTLKILQILIEKHIASGSLLDNQNITIISRRMIRDEKIRQLRQRVGRLGGNPGLLKIKENRKNLVNQTFNQKDRSSSSSSSSSSKIIKDIYLDCVFLTKEEHRKLIERDGNIVIEKAIEVLNNYKMSSGKKYKSDYHTLLNWAIERVKSEIPGKPKERFSPDLCRFCSESKPLDGKKYCQKCTDYFLNNPTINFSKEIKKYIEEVKIDNGDLRIEEKC